MSYNAISKKLFPILIYVLYTSMWHNFRQKAMGRQYNLFHNDMAFIFLFSRMPQMLSFYFLFPSLSQRFDKKRIHPRQSFPTLRWMRTIYRHIGGPASRFNKKRKWKSDVYGIMRAIDRRSVTWQKQIDRDEKWVCASYVLTNTHTLSQHKRTRKKLWLHSNRILPSYF